MDLVKELVREIKKCKITELEKVSNLIRELQVFRDTSDDSINPDLIFFGLATGQKRFLTTGYLNSVMMFV